MQVYVLALTLLGYLCNVSSTMKSLLVRKGFIRQLCVMLHKRCFIPLRRPKHKVVMLQLIEQISALLLYFSLGPKPCIDALVFEALVPNLLKLCEKTNQLTYGYSGEVQEAFRDLAVERDLVGQCRKLNKEQISGIYLDEFGEACYKLRLPESGYTVELYDTEHPEQDVLLVMELATRDLLWWDEEADVICGESSQNHNGEVEDSTWMDVHVTYIVDGEYFWAQVGGEETLAMASRIRHTLEGWPEEQRSLVLKAPKPGTFVCVCDQGQGYYRGQVMASEGDHVQLFAVDYGSIEVVHLSDLLYLVPEMNIKTPPLAVLCRLKG